MLLPPVRRGHRALGVAVGDAARDHERVVVDVIDVAERVVGRECPALVEVVERLDVASCGSDELGHAAGLGDRLPRSRQLRLLHALVRGEEGDPQAAQFVCHRQTPFGRHQCRRPGRTGTAPAFPPTGRPCVLARFFCQARGGETVTPDQVAAQFACGPDPKRHLGMAQRFVDAGFDHLVAMNAGPDPDGFMDFFAGELAAPMRALTPRRPGIS